MNCLSSQAPRDGKSAIKIIADRLPFGPRDYQLEGITQALDGQDVVAVSATGSGKLAYIYMVAIALLELAKNRLLSPIKKKKIPEDPATWIDVVFVVQAFSGWIFGGGAELYWNIPEVDVLSGVKLDGVWPVWAA